VTRAQLRDEPRWWLVAGAIVGISFYNKLLVAILLIGMAVGLAVVGPRSKFRDKYLWLAVAIALVIGSPNLIYQATHHFPQFTMAQALNDNNAGDVRILVLPMQFILPGVFLAPIWIAGFVSLWRRPAWRPVRFLTVAYLVAVVLTFVGGGQIYYAFGLQAFLLAAGFVSTVDWFSANEWRRRLVIAGVAVNAVLSTIISTPVLPLSALRGSFITATNPTIGDQVGWPEYVRQVAAVYDGLPASDKARAVVLTGNYGEAGSIVRYGPEYGLPPVYSGQNELHRYGPPPADRTVVIVWTEGQGIQRRLAGCVTKATMDNGYGVDNEEQGSTVSICGLPDGGWPAVWPSLQHYD